MSPWLWITFALIVDGAAGLAGGLLPDAWLARRRPLLIGFAAGALLAAALLDILPEATASYGRHALDFTLGAIVAMALFEWSIARHHHRRGGAASPALPLALLGSDALHNIGDGAAIAASFLVSTRLGLITSLAVIVHEVPEEIGDYVLLRAAGLGKRAALLALAGVQLSAAIGAAATLLAWSSFARMSGAVLAVAGGTFIYIGAADLLPEVLRVDDQQRSQRGALLGFVLGVLALVLENRL